MPTLTTPDQQMAQSEAAAVNCVADRPEAELFKVLVAHARHQSATQASLRAVANFFAVLAIINIVITALWIFGAITVEFETTRF